MDNKVTSDKTGQVDDNGASLDAATAILLRASNLPMSDFSRLLVTTVNGEVTETEIIVGLSDEEVEAKGLDQMEAQAKRYLLDNKLDLPEIGTLRGEFRKNEVDDGWTWAGDEDLNFQLTLTVASYTTSAFKTVAKE